tara:strand:- start:919 stop:1029 length:111 start_codon:yes stop_codon:yes gene_type:complete
VLFWFFKRVYDYASYGVVSNFLDEEAGAFSARIASL